MGKMDEKVAGLPETVTLSREQFAELLQARTGASGLTPDVLQAIMDRTAQTSAEAMQKALKPENTEHPGVSAYSYPEGDLARPRPVLPFELFWQGFPIHREPETSAWWELEGYLTLKPGEFFLSKRNGDPNDLAKVTVRATYRPDGSVEKFTVQHPMDRDVRFMLPSPYIWCYQIAHYDERPVMDTFVEAMSALLTLELVDRKSKASGRPVPMKATA